MPPEDTLAQDLLQSWEETLAVEVGSDLSGYDTLTTYRPWDSEPGGSPLEAANTPRGERFVPLEQIGRGGMGVVLRARQTSLGRLVAVKTLHDGLPEDSDTQARKRGQFLAEARVHGSLEHPNIVPVHELDSAPNGAPMLAMKLVDGQSWSEVLRSGKYDLAFHLEVLIQVCNAVAYAHSREIAHNDLKPSNVVLGPFGEVLLMDWGLAVSFAAERPSGGLRHRSQLRGPCGTPGYVPPELATGRGEDVGPWTDTYLLGGILYRLLSGRPPHGGSFLQALVASTRGRLPRLDPAWPAQLRTVCQRALAADPGQRYASVAALQDDLQAWLRHRESLGLSEAAAATLHQCEQRAARLAGLDTAARSELYDDYARTVAGFGQALQLWQDNEHARAGERQSRESYARAALSQGDLLLARTQASKLGAQSSLLAEVAQAERRKIRERSVRRLLAGAVWTLLALVLAGMTWGLRVYDGLLAEIQSQNETILAEKSLARRQEAFARERGEIAAESFMRMTTEIKGKLLLQLGDARAYQVALEILSQARDGWQRLLQTELAADQVSTGTALALMGLGDLEHRMGEHAAALEHFQQARELLAALRRAHPDDAVLARHGRDACFQHCGLLMELERVSEAVALLREVWQDVHRQAEQRPEDSELQLAQAEVLHALGSARVALGENSAAEADCRQAIALLEQRGAAQGVPSEQQLLARVQRSLAGVLELRGALGEALHRVGVAEELERLLLRQDTVSVVVRNQLALTLARKSRILHGLRDLDGSAAALREARALRRWLVDNNPLAVWDLQALLLDTQRLGKACFDQGDLAGARELYEQVLRLRLSVLERDPQDPSALSALAHIHQHLAELCESEKNYRVAWEHLQVQGQIHRRLLAADTANLLVREKLARGDLFLGRLQVRAGDGEAALESFSRAAVEAGRLRAQVEDSLDSLQLWMACQLELAEMLWLQGRLEQAAEVGEEVVKLGRRRSAELPDAPELWESLLIALNQLSNVLLDAGRLERARQVVDEAESLARALLALDPRARRSRAVLGENLLHKGQLLRRMGQLESAFAAAQEGLGLVRELAEQDQGNLSAQREVLVHLLLYGDLAWDRGAPELAAPAFAEAVELARAQLAANPGDTESRRELASSLANHAEALDELSMPRAGVLFAEAVQLQRSLCASEPERPVYRDDLAETLVLYGSWLAGAGQAQAARELLDEGLTLKRELTAAGVSVPRNLAVALDKVGDICLALGELARADALFVESLECKQALLEADPEAVLARRDVAVSVHNLARLANARGDLLRTRELLAEAAERMAELVPLLPSLAAEHNLFSGQLEQIRQACWARGLWFPEERTLVEGDREPESYGDHVLLALVRLDKGSYGEAVVLYERAFALQAPAGEDLISAAQAAGLAHERAEGETAAALQRQALDWLAALLQGFETELQGQAPALAAQSRAELASFRGFLQREDSSFASLRKLPEFQALFE